MFLVFSTSVDKMFMLDLKARNRSISHNSYIYYFYIYQISKSHNYIVSGFFVAGQSYNIYKIRKNHENMWIIL